MTDSVADRARLVAALRAELVGPAPAGQSVDTRGPLKFKSLEESYGPFVDISGEEVLSWDRPVARYGVGVLFPSSQNEAPSGAGAVDEVTEAREASEMATASELVSEGAAKEIEEKIAKRSSRDAEKQDELDLSATTSRRPSSMGLSFLAHLDPTDELLVIASGGRYDIVRVAVGGREGRRWFVRRPWTIRAFFPARDIVAKDQQIPKPARIERTELEGLDVDVELFTRSRNDGSSLLTVSLINRTFADRAVDRFCLFQVEMRVSVINGDETVSRVQPYPTAPLTKLDVEEQSLSLLYRGQRAFAVGHGCSADWDAPVEDSVSTVIANVFPVTEIPSITPDISDAEGPMTVPMRQLADLDPGAEVAMRKVIDLYAAWVEEQKAGMGSFPTEMRQVAERHIVSCGTALQRMRRGLDLLRRDAKVGLAFRLANHAMLLQQIRSEVREPRRIAPKSKGTTALRFSAPFPTVTDVPSERRGAWRPFQIAFILMTLASVVDAADTDRERVELIWFPTGGGKTEAYLGLTAFSLFLRRLREPNDAGVDVLMRYTLRLLTAQQFQRASTLICAMEYLRRTRTELGELPFTIGIWLGGDTTPNNRKDAYESLQKLRRPGSENPFLLTKCPWCGAQIGPIATHGVVGYGWDGTTVRMRCSDGSCDFFKRLPVLVIDEDLYAEPPSMVIGTVDKFAMLAWRPEARALFGLDIDGVRRNSPPNIVIQDELHLISGPLGTMVGLYEGVVEELCTDRRGPTAKPKIITSTATARRFKDQVRALFARTETTLFPPPGLDIADSFFARYARRPDGKLAPGRLYVGVHATNHMSLITTQVQAMATLLQAANSLEEDGRDPWWTVLAFFNTLRELGTSLSLVHSNVPMHLKAMRNRRPRGVGEMRYVDKVLELTGRLRNDEVPKVMAELEVEYGSTQERPVDVCLSSNIIEVGVDIDRLSLMVVVGQPKSTSQYIQVTGRIGRRWSERPGLVVTLLNTARPRDRSHYEQFRSYHERLYSHVEPTTVTPFSPPAVERALHAALAAFVRQVGDREAAAMVKGVPKELLSRFEELVRARVEIVDPDEGAFVRETLDKRLAELKVWRSRPWGSFVKEEDQVLAVAEALFQQVYFGRTWPTPLSMRTVDAECELEITNAYAMESVP